jgi:haloalkane dehalogenase
VGILRTPEDRFKNLFNYNFKSNHIQITDPDLGKLRMHYLDEGSNFSKVALLLHGQPTWSYLYREMIPILVKNGIRVIAPDLIGFGKSDKPSSRASYTYNGHVDWLSQLFLKLKLKNVTLFGQDWGGLIGLRLLCDNQEAFDAVMIGNTALPTGDHDLGEPFKLWREFTQTNESFKIGPIIHRGSVSGLTQLEVDAYNAPFPTEKFKAGARQFPVLVPSSKEDPARKDQLAAWEVLKKWKKPFLTCFSDQDPIMKNGEKIFIKLIPGAQRQNHFITKNAGHFLQEDDGINLAKEMVNLIQSLS